MGKEKVQNDTTSRDQFSDRWGFILSCIGSAVGVANVWAFPYRVAKYGGGAFLLAYAIIAAILGMVGVCGEICFGRWGGTGPLGTFRKALTIKKKPFKDVGIVPVLGGYAIGIGYAIIVGWVMRYLVGSVTGSALKSDTGTYFAIMAENFGSVGWHIFALALTLIIMIVGVSGGIEKVNKVMMPLFFLLFIILAIVVGTRPGAIEGYKYLFIPEWEYLWRPQTWIMALGQCFFSLSLAGSGTVVYGSYLSKEEDAVTCARLITIFGSSTALLASMVVIPAVFAYDLELASGPPLLFIVLPMIFKDIPGGSVVAVLFFTAILFAGITSIINLFETPIEALQQRFSMNRSIASILVIVVAGFIGIFLENGEVVGKWMDIVSIYIIPLGALISAVILFWLMGTDFTKEQFSLGRNKMVGNWVHYLGKYVFCFIVILVLILGIFMGGI